MLTLFKHWISSGSYARRLFLTYALISLVPLLVVTPVLYSLASSNIRQSTSDFVNLYVSQTESEVNNYISSLDSMTTLLLSEYDLQDYLFDPASYPMSSKIEFNERIHRLLLGFYAQHPNVSGITLVGTDHYAHHVGSNRDVYYSELLVEEPWYQALWQSSGGMLITPPHSQTYKQLSLKEKVLTIGRVIKNRSGIPVAVIFIDMSPSQLFEFNHHFANIAESYQAHVQVLFPDGSLIFDHSGYDTLVSPSVVPRAAPQGKVYESTVWSEEDYVKIRVFIPQEMLQQQLKLFNLIIVLSVIFVIIAVFILSLWLSNRFNRPMQRLIGNMRHVEDGLYRPLPEASGNDEFTRLTKAYNTMLLKIKYLIEDVYEANIKRNQAQYQALQQQINPHMLYNTLESIRMKAEIHRAPEVARMIKTLGKMFRITLKQDTAHHYVRDEIDHVRIYVELQNIRYNNRFKLVSHIDSVVMEQPLIQMILQPIIENSVMHGFLEHDRHYTINIRGYEQQGHVVLRIVDNGAGIPPDRLSQLQASLYSIASLDPEPVTDKPEWIPRIGLRNVQERIKLRYGKDWGLRIASAPGNGTTVELCLPKQ